MRGSFVVVVLGDDTVKRAVALDELLRKQSPLALVRAVELADEVLRGGAPEARGDQVVTRRA